MTSNCFVENLSIFANLDKTVFVPCKVSKSGEHPLIIDNKIFAFICKEEKYARFVNEIKKWTKKEIVQKEYQIIEVMQLVLREKYDGVIFQDAIKNNDFFTETFIDYADIYKKRDVIKVVDLLQKQLTIKNFPYKRTLIGIMDEYFTYIGDIKDGNNYFVETTKNGDKKLFRIFTTPVLAIEYRENTNTNGEITINTLRNIVKQLPEDFGVVIDIGRPYGTSINRDILEIGVFQSEDSWNRDNIKDRINYFSNLDEFYVLTNPCGDYDKGITTFACVIDRVNKKDVLSLGIYESYKDASHHTDATARENIENIKPIGIINNHNLFEKVLQRAYTVGIKYITFDYGTNRQLTLKIQDAYEKFFNKKFVHVKIDETILIHFADKTPKQNLSDVDKEHYNRLAVSQLNKLVSNGTCEELLYVLSKKIQDFNNELNVSERKITEKSNKINIQINNIFITLMKKLMNKKHFHLVVHPETKQFVLSKTGSPYLQIETKYINNIQEIIDFDFCDKSIEMLQKNYKKVIFTNNRNIGQEVPINVIADMYKEIANDEIDRSKIMIYLTFVCDLTIDEANSFYDLLFVNIELLNEFKLFVFAGADNFPPLENQFNFKGNTAEQIFKEKRFAKKYMAYFEIAEMLCK